MFARCFLAVFAAAFLFFAGVPGIASAATKVAVCHTPPGNPSNFHTIHISEKALDKHLDHGDFEGECERTVFITSGVFDGNLGGIAGANAKCQAAADSAGSVVPAGTYHAWLSTDAGGSPNTNFTQSTAGYIRPDGVFVADDYADLTDGDIQATIKITELGGENEVNRVAWTSTDEFGDQKDIPPPAAGLDCSFTQNCFGYTDNRRGRNGFCGSVGRSQGAGTGAGWSAVGGFGCIAGLSLYCFQQ